MKLFTKIFSDLRFQNKLQHISVPPPPVSFDCLYTFKAIPVFNKITFFAVPSAGPSNVSAIATSSTTIVVEWGTVPKLEQNGILEGYKVVYAGASFVFFY